MKQSDIKLWFNWWKNESLWQSITCTGKRCETNIDECINNPCGINGECKDEINGYKCECNSGFSGQNCELGVTCPIEDFHYKVVDDQCYYFKDELSYEQHKQFCKTLFSGNGRLFEPKNLVTWKKVYKVAQDFCGRCWWYIGIRDPYKNGTLTFESNSLTIPFTIPFNDQCYYYANQDCVVIDSSGEWCRDCDEGHFAICENTK